MRTRLSPLGKSLIVFFFVASSALPSHGQQPITCNGVPATIVGTAGNDTLTGTNSNDVIVGLGGNDTINGGNGNDVICGGDGSDTINGSNGDDTIFGEAGNDILNGENGNDRLNGGIGLDTLDGGTGNDVLEGGEDADSLNGRNGDDNLSGGTGNDTLIGENGNDILDGGPGADTLNGGSGTDSCTTGETLSSCESVPSNQPPTANAGPAQTVPVGTTVQLNGTGSSDPEGGALTFSWTIMAKPAASTATLSGATTATPTLLIDRAGSYTIQLSVSDGSLSSSDIVIISTDNSAPVAAAGPDQSGTVGQTLTLDGSNSSDVDGDALTYHWTIVSRPTGSSATLSPPTAVTPTLRLDKAGTYTVQLLVHDGTVPSAPDTMTISTTNSAPVADAGPNQSGTVGQTLTLDGSGSSDVDGDALSYQWSLTNQPPGSTVVLNAPSSATPTLALDRPGTYVGQLIVNDGTTNSAPGTVTLSTVNSAPVANAGPAQSYPVGATVMLDGSGSNDVDGDALTYQWSLTTKPATSTATLSDPTAVQPTFVIDTPGTYVGQLIVNDGTTNSVPGTVTLSTVNSAPVANAGPAQSYSVGATVLLDGSGSNDGDGDALTYQWALLSTPGESFASLTTPTSVTTAFVIDAPGTYTVQLIVTDGTVDSQPVTVTISTLNSKPVAKAGTDQERLVGQTVQLDGSGSHDVDNNPLVYFWAFTAVPDGSTATLSNETTRTPMFMPDLTGTYVVQLIVNDGQLDSDPDTITLLVPDTTPPAPTDLGKITVSPVTNGQVTITGSAGSVESGAQVTLTNPRTNESVTVTANADGSFTAQLGAQAGDSLSIMVSDAAGNSSPLRTLQIAAAVQVAITSPAHGTAISGNRVRVSGTVQGPLNTGVVVNGVVALVYNGTFVAENVALVSGQNTITATATPLGGPSVQTQVMVSSDEAPILLEVGASPTSGIAPLEVTFTYQFGSTTPIQSLSLDLDGNGTFDFTTTDPNAPLQYTYTVPGLYLARLRVTDQTGAITEAQTAVAVQDVGTLDALFKSMWNGMNAALVAGDIPTALKFLDSAAQEKYGPVWQVLLPHMAEIVASYSPVQALSISNDIAEYGLNRTINGEKRLYLIYFLKNDDGVWRVDAM